MREVFATLAQWLEESREFAAATVVDVRWAQTSPIGTTVLVDASMSIAGSIGAGCRENEIIEAAALVAKHGAACIMEMDLNFGDELYGRLGCGGSMRVAVWRPHLAFARTARAIAAGDDDVEMTIPLGTEVFTHLIRARDSLFLVGATALAAEIARLARNSEYRTIVVDPRPLFATRQRLPDAVSIVGEWPDEYLPRVLTERSAVIVLSHDAKLDLPGLRAALRSPASFIGLLGSRQSQAWHRVALKSGGFDAVDLERIHGPVGLDLGASAMSETALSILAELVAARTHRSARPLSAGAGTIHARGLVVAAAGRE